MPSESELRRRLHEGTLPRGEIDLDAVLRRARARRRPRVALAGAGSVLAIAAIAVPAIALNALPGGSVMSASEPAPESAGGAAADGAAEGGAGGGAEDTALLIAPAESLNPCAVPVTEVPPAASGLVITVAPVAATAQERGIPVTVTLTNAGAERVTGTTGGRPALTLVRDGVTIWHTNGPQDLVARIVDLAPGQSMSYAASFDPVVCSPDDDAAGSFRPDLPAAGPGTYALQAAIDVTSDDGSVVELVTGPAATVTLG
ncbi:MAG: hypothetical protein R2717_07010 [Schumannella sp.]|nr:hypothetical protein [Microbacteriaceae bacterium]